MNTKAPFLYLGDRDLYYNTLVPNRPMSRSKAAEWMVSTKRCTNELDAIRILEDLKQFPVSEQDFADLKASKKATKPDWPAIYEAVQEHIKLYSRITSKGERQIYACDEINQVSLISYKKEEDLINSLMYNRDIWEKLKLFYGTSSLMEPFVNQISLRQFLTRIVVDHLLLDQAKRIDEQPKRFSWEPDEKAFKKFNEALVVPGAAPTWAEFTKRLNYPDVFKAWIWALFEPTNNIRQCMWLTGAGNDGKSAVQKAIREVFGEAHVYDCKKGDEGRQWFQHNAFGKCLVNYADCDNPHLLNSQAIKQLTGGDATSIEPKGLSAFSGEIYSKLFVSSNMPPKINPDFEAQTSRLIRLKLAPIADNEPKDEGFKGRLVDEAYHFLYECREQYKLHINEGNDALILPEVLAQEIENECAEEDYYITQEFIRKYIEYKPLAECRPSELNQALKFFVTIEQHYSNDKTKYIQSKFEAKMGLLGHRMQNRQISGDEYAAYVGFKIKDEQLERLKLEDKRR